MMINKDIVPNGFNNWESVLEYMNNYPDKEEFSFHYFDLSSGYRIKKEITLNRSFLTDKIIEKKKNNFIEFIKKSLNSSEEFKEKVKSGFFNNFKIIKTI